MALPHELNDGQRSALAAEITRALVQRYQFAAQASLHSPDAKGGLNWHWHLHVLAITLRLDADGLADKTRELDGGTAGRAEIEWVREVVARVTNLVRQSNFGLMTHWQQSSICSRTPGVSSRTTPAALLPLPTIRVCAPTCAS